jgi:hypothetical protein
VAAEPGRAGPGRGDSACVKAGDGLPGLSVKPTTVASPALPACRKLSRRLRQTDSRRHPPWTPSSPSTGGGGHRGIGDPAEDRFDDGLAAATGGSSGLGRQLEGHALFQERVLEDAPRGAGRTCSSWARRPVTMNVSVRQVGWRSSAVRDLPRSCTRHPPAPARHGYRCCPRPGRALWCSSARPTRLSSRRRR